MATLRAAVCDSFAATSCHDQEPDDVPLRAGAAACAVAAWEMEVVLPHGAACTTATEDPPARATTLFGSNRDDGLLPPGYAARAERGEWNNCVGPFEADGEKCTACRNVPGGAAWMPSCSSLNPEGGLRPEPSANFLAVEAGGRDGEDRSRLANATLDEARARAAEASWGTPSSAVLVPLPRPLRITAPLAGRFRVFRRAPSPLSSIACR